MWEAALSTKSRILLRLIQKTAFRNFTQCSKISLFIHAFLLASYLVARFSFEMFLKHRGFADFPMTNGFSLSVPVAFVQSKTVIQSLSFFFPLTALVESVWLGVSRKKKPVSSALYTSSGLYCESNLTNSCLCSGSFSIGALSDSPWILNC